MGSGVSASFGVLNFALREDADGEALARDGLLHPAYVAQIDADAEDHDASLSLF